MCASACVHACMGTVHMAGAWGRQKRAYEPLNWSSWQLLSAMWVLQPRSSAKGASTLNCCHLSSPVLPHFPSHFLSFLFLLCPLRMNYTHFKKVFAKFSSSEACLVCGFCLALADLRDTVHIAKCIALLFQFPPVHIFILIQICQLLSKCGLTEWLPLVEADKL